MVEKKHGISPDLLIHPGETIADLLEERDMSQKELAKRTGVSEPFLSDVIHGRKDISKGLAMGLEYAFGVRSSFWLNLQANYDAELMELQKEQTISNEEREVYASLHDIIAYLRKISILPEGETKEQTVLRLRSYFHISELSGLRNLVPSGAFRMTDKATINPDVLGAWLCLCKAQGEKTVLNTQFEKSCVNELIEKLKTAMFEKGNLQIHLKTLFAEYGIDFNIVHNFRGAPVQGYICRKNEGTYQMTVTLRGAFADIIWFSIFHELGHIVNGDIPKSGNFIDAVNGDNAEREMNADLFASNALIDPESYQRFTEKSDYSYNAIRIFSETQGVPAYIVIGRLQKEGKIPYGRFQQYKVKYKWAESA